MATSTTAHDILADESKCEFIVVWETAMTDSAKYADILLPDLFRFEQVSQIGTGGDNAYMISGQPCTTPKFERKTLYDALTLIADKMGVKEQFTEGKTQEEWIKELYEKTREKDTELRRTTRPWRWASTRATNRARPSRSRRSATIRRPTRWTPLPARSRSTPRRWPASPPPGSLARKISFRPSRVHARLHRDRRAHRRVPLALQRLPLSRSHALLLGRIELLKEVNPQERGSTPPTRRSAASSRATRSA